MTFMAEQLKCRSCERQFENFSPLGSRPKRCLRCELERAHRRNAELKRVIEELKGTP